LFNPLDRFCLDQKPDRSRLSLDGILVGLLASQHVSGLAAVCANIYGGKPLRW